MFAGLFIQWHGATEVEPIVRSGSLAMIPSDLLGTTLNKPGHIYLAEVHSYGGNSGSPVFIDVNRFKTGFGFDYRFLGVLAGTVHESTDFTFHVTTDYQGALDANSGISMVVPADELRKILYSPKLQKARDEGVAQVLQQKK